MTKPAIDTALRAIANERNLHTRQQRLMKMGSQILREAAQNNLRRQQQPPPKREEPAPPRPGPWQPLAELKHLMNKKKAPQGGQFDEVLDVK
jgi:hypothetical protein